MNKLALSSLLATAAVAAAPCAHAQPEQARVLSATPIVQQVGVPQQVCSNETVYTGPRTSGGGAVLGAIAGGAAGNAIGGGSGRAAATAIGVIGGALLGNQIEGQGRPDHQNVQRCHTQTFYENRTVGYTVVYEYAGRQYTTQTQSDPGRFLNVQVQPLGSSAPDAYGNTYSTQPSSNGQFGPAGVVTSTYGAAYSPAPVYPQGYAVPAPLYLSPGVVVDIGYGQGWGYPPSPSYPRHPRHPRHWR